MIDYAFLLLSVFVWLAADMEQQKRRWILCAFCLFFVAGLSMLRTPIHDTGTSVKLKSLASTMPLFGNNLTEEVILECITGKVIGVRPRQHTVDTVDVRQLRVNRSHRELDSHRKALFDYIFHNRIWGKNPKVGFSASGRGLLAASYIVWIV